ncbi:DUF1641 domain-containing protein [Salinirubrum litoreum]|uniref:DUF1641 domain-containing protein n=1 Tax=Salinirubrum litoreum TaxID=1126234 RepID=A0ABD5RDP1_9EURY|nr:DUF1641 domain-containing protein [Salinirubrum litoreum]
MSDSPPQQSTIDAEQLEAAIAENPEAVAAFVDRLDAVNDLLDVLALGTEALDDEMVAELSGTGATLAESADGLATEETVRLAEAVGRNGDDLTEALETVVELQRTGTLDELVALADTVSLATHALDDEMVVSLARTGASLGEVADVASDDDTARGLRTLLGAVGDATRDGEVEPLGPFGLLRSLWTADVRVGLGYAVAVLRNLGRRLRP